MRSTIDKSYRPTKNFNRRDDRIGFADCGSWEDSQIVLCLLESARFASDEGGDFGHERKGKVKSIRLFYHLYFYINYKYSIFLLLALISFQTTSEHLLCDEDIMVDNRVFSFIFSNLVSYDRDV